VPSRGLRGSGGSNRSTLGFESIEPAVFFYRNRSPPGPFLWAGSAGRTEPRPCILASHSARHVSEVLEQGRQSQSAAAPDRYRIGPWTVR
jgi:hypothetical protein